MVALIAILNPFGITDWSEVHTRDVWQEIYAHQYEPKANGRQRDARDAITVVYIDDAARNAIVSRHQMDAMDIAQVIDDIVQSPGPQAAPRAIFVDLLLGGAAPRGHTAEDLVRWTSAEKEACLFKGRAEQTSAFRCLLVKIGELTAYERWKDNPDCQKNTLVKILCIERAGGTPVLFADSSPTLTDGSRPPSDSPSAAGFAALNRVAATSPVLVDNRHYPLIASYDGPEGKPTFSLYPAAALYAAYCQRNTCAPSPAADAEGNWSKAFESAVDVVWGLGRPSQFTEMRDRLEGESRPACSPAQPGLVAAASHFLRLLAGGVHPGREEAHWCLYTNAIPYRAIEDGIPPADARLALGGKIVLLGAQLADNNDRVPASLYGALPGVYYHAMALDNLIQRGAQYPKVAVKITSWLDVTWTEVASEAAIFLTTLGIALITGWLAARDAADAKPAASAWGWRRAGLLLAVVCVIVGLLFVMSLVGENLIPENFNIAAITVVCLLALKDLAVEVSEPARSRLWARFQPRKIEAPPAMTEEGARNSDGKP